MICTVWQQAAQTVVMCLSIIVGFLITYHLPSRRHKGSSAKRLFGQSNTYLYLLVLPKNTTTIGVKVTDSPEANYMGWGTNRVQRGCRVPYKSPIDSSQAISDRLGIHAF
jgi:hypothetical protein